MRVADNTNLCRCEKCGDVYALIEGYNDEETCFWCKQGIRLQQGVLSSRQGGDKGKG